MICPRDHLPFPETPKRAVLGCTTWTGRVLGKAEGWADLAGPPQDGKVDREQAVTGVGGRRCTNCRHPLGKAGATGWKLCEMNEGCNACGSYDTLLKQDLVRQDLTVGPSPHHWDTSGGLPDRGLGGGQEGRPGEWPKGPGQAEADQGAGQVQEADGRHARAVVQAMHEAAGLDGGGLHLRGAADKWIPTHNVQSAICICMSVHGHTHMCAYTYTYLAPSRGSRKISRGSAKNIGCGWNKVGVQTLAWLWT